MPLAENAGFTDNSLVDSTAASIITNSSCIEAVDRMLGDTDSFTVPYSGSFTVKGFVELPCKKFAVEFWPEGCSSIGISLAASVDHL